MEDLSGRQLGRYILLERIGRGGMAEVYKGVQPSANREVALKVLPRELGLDPEFMERFRREGRLIASLEHPAVVPVYDLDEEDGLPFIVMRLVTGGSLAERLAPGPLPPPEAIRLAGQIGDALDHAHGRGVVHRDIKPSNILLDTQGNAMVADFGVAKLLEPAVNLTRTGWVVGTPEYMSPEQAQGDSVDHRSDLYSLALLMFAMLTGQPAYAGATPAGILVRQIHDPIPSARERNQALPYAADRFFLGALAKNRRERFSSAREMTAALSEALAEPVALVRAKQPAGQVMPRPAQGVDENAETMIEILPPGSAPGLPEAVPRPDEGEGWLHPLEEPSRWNLRKSRMAFIVAGAALALVLMAAVAHLAVRPRGSASSVASGSLLPLTGKGLVSVSEVVGDLYTRTGDGPPVPASVGQAIAFEPERFFWTGRIQDDRARLVLPGGALLFLSSDAEVELVEYAATSLTLELLRSRVLVRLPPGFPLDFRFVVTAPSGATARVGGSVMGVGYDPVVGQLTLDCLEGKCWAGSPASEASVSEGNSAIVDSELRTTQQPAIDYRLWLFAPEAAPTPSPVPYGGGVTWADRFDEAERQRLRQSDRVLRPLSGLLAILTLGAWVVGGKGRPDQHDLDPHRPDAVTGSARR